MRWAPRAGVAWMLLLPGEREGTGCWQRWERPGAAMAVSTGAMGESGRV